MKEGYVAISPEKSVEERIASQLVKLAVKLLREEGFDPNDVQLLEQDFKMLVKRHVQKGAQIARI